MVALVECTRRPAFESPIDGKHIKVHMSIGALMADHPKVSTPLVVVALEGVPSCELLLFLGVGWALGHVLWLGLRFGVLLHHRRVDLGPHPLLLDY
jgi:hypothetical protein